VLFAAIVGELWRRPLASLQSDIHEVHRLVVSDKPSVTSAAGPRRDLELAIVLNATTELRELERLVQDSSLVVRASVVCHKNCSDGLRSDLLAWIDGGLFPRSLSLGALEVILHLVSLVSAPAETVSVLLWSLSPALGVSPSARPVFALLGQSWHSSGLELVTSCELLVRDGTGVDGEGL
jgi:hypothetical protein